MRDPLTIGSLETLPGARRTGLQQGDELISSRVELAVPDYLDSATLGRRSGRNCPRNSRWTIPCAGSGEELDGRAGRIFTRLLCGALFRAAPPLTRGWSRVM